MKNVLGTNLTLTLYGESHGAAVGAVLDGLAPGLPVEEDYIRAQLSLRRPVGDISTPRQEPDRFVIDSGVYRGKTTGTPLSIRIPNENVRSEDYSAMEHIARPGHADYTGYVKYRGCNDPRGGGHFSGRVTAALVAAGAIVRYGLEQKGIVIATHIARLGGIDDRKFADWSADAAVLNRRPFAVLDEMAGERMQTCIRDARAAGDSVGGVLETVALGVPAGVGEPWFSSVESVLSAALFAIPAVKGVEFGDGFALCDRRGSEANDSLRVAGERVVTVTNHNGGINGGITNGMPVTFRTAVKPTPTIGRAQDTVDFVAGADTSLQGKGRHDPCIVHRARVVVDNVTALVLADLLAGRYGADWLA